MSWPALVCLRPIIPASSTIGNIDGGYVESIDMKLAVKIVVVVFLLVVLIEVLTRDPYVVYDCRDTDQWNSYPDYVIRECLKHKPRITT